MEKIAFIDIDGTLTPSNVSSWEVITEGVDGSVDELYQSLNRLLKGQIKTNEAIIQVLRNWQSAGIATREVIEGALNEMPLEDDAEKLINGLVDCNITPVLLTGSTNMTAQVVASRLGVKHYLFNSEVKFDSRGELYGLTYNPEQAELKLEQAKDFAARNGLSSSDCIAIGDGANDSLMFEWAGRAIPVIKEDDGASNKKAVAQTLSEALRISIDLA